MRSAYIVIVFWLITTIIPALYFYSYYDDCQKIGYEEAVWVLEDGGFEVYCSKDVRVKLP